MAFIVDLQFGYPALYAIAGVLTIALPAMLVLMEWLVWRFARSAYAACHLLILSTLLLLLLLPAFKQVVFLPGAMVCLVSILSVVVVAWCYANVRAVRHFVTLASPGILVFPIVFIVAGTASLATTLPDAVRTARWRPVPVVMLVLDVCSGSSLLTSDL